MIGPHLSSRDDARTAKRVFFERQHHLQWDVLGKGSTREEDVGSRGERADKNCGFQGLKKTPDPFYEWFFGVPWQPRGRPPRFVGLTAAVDDDHWSPTLVATTSAFPSNFHGTCKASPVGSILATLGHLRNL